MPAPSGRSLAALLVVAVLGSGFARAAQDDELGRLIAMPPSPGVEALLMAHVRDARVPQRWRSLLTHEDPQLRLTAARVLAVSGHQAAAPDLLAALAREQAPEVLAELLPALAAVVDDSGVAAVIPQVGRAGRVRARQVLEGLAAVRPGLMAGHLLSPTPPFERAELTAAVYEGLARTAPAQMAPFDAALSATTHAVVLEGALRGAAAAGHRLPDSLVGAALRHPDVHPAGAVAYLAATYGTPEKAREDDALRRAELPPVPPDASPDRRWFIELERRWLGHEPAVDLQAVIPMLRELESRSDLSAPALKVLTGAERSAFARHFGLSSDRVSALVVEDPVAATTAAATLSDVPAAIVDGVLRLTECRPRSGDERFVSIRYRPDRRPEHVVLPPDGWSPGCQRAARAIVTLTYGPPRRAETDRPWMLLRLDQAFAACLAARQWDWRAAPESFDESDLRAPRKLHHEQPTYPALAHAARIEGVVQVEATIERSGCIADARIVASTHALLDTAALSAVARWRYEPTRLNGEPVSALMRVTVNFTLR